MKKVFFASGSQEDSDERISYLELTGFEIIEIGSSEELIEACRQTRPDFVILDALIPGKNGFETAREVRELLGPQVPMVLCSRIYKTDAFREEAHRVGCNALLTLPVQLGEFLACVQTVSQVAVVDEQAEAA